MKLQVTLEPVVENYDGTEIGVMGTLLEDANRQVIRRARAQGHKR